MSDHLRVDCEEWRNLSEQFPVEMQFVTEMLIEADEEPCQSAAVRP